MLTMRVETAAEYGEPRDAVSHDWIDYLQHRSWEVHLLPNRLGNPRAFLESVKPDGIILTGGNDIGPTGTEQGLTPSVSMDRDRTEKKVLDFAVNSRCPVLGVCRGMQFINVYFGGRVERNLHDVTDQAHAGGSHTVDLIHAGFKKWCGDSILVTNSYHNQGIIDDSLAPDLIVTARAGKIIESLMHRRLPVVGIQWHPERTAASASLDDNLFLAMIDKFEGLRDG
jgi:N5-(cytidine 5'-diphosphoramidyl)-L-glutamine hydrolase